MKAPCCLLGAGALPRPPEARQGSGRADRCPGVSRGPCIYLWCVMWWVIVVVAAAAAGSNPDCAVRTDAEDVASKAYVSPQVVEGVVQQVNRSLPGTPYTATILVTKKLRAYSGPGRVKKRDIVNLTFLPSPSPTSDPPSDGGGDLCLVTADLRYRRKYLFFLSSGGGGGNSRGAAPQSVAPPDPASKKLRRLVRKTVCKKCGEAPKVSGLLEDSVVENYNLTLECSVEGNPLPDVQWFKDDQPLHNSRKIRIRTRVKKLRRWKARYNRDVTSTAEEAGRQQLFRRRLRARRAEVERRLDQLSGQQADGDLPDGDTAQVIAVGRRDAVEGGVGRRDAVGGGVRRSQGRTRRSRLRRKRQGGVGEAGNRRRVGGQRRRARGSTRRQAREEAKGRRMAKTQEDTEDARPETTTESTQTRRTRARSTRVGGEARRTGTRNEPTGPEGETRRTGRRRHERAREEDDGARRTGGARRTQRERQTEGSARRTGARRHEQGRQQRQQQQENEEETTTGGEATTTRRRLGRRGRQQGSREQRRRTTTANPTGGSRRRHNQSRLSGSNNNSSNASANGNGTRSRSRRGRGGRRPNTQKRVLVSHLIVRNIVASDAGRYKCVARSVAGQDEAQAIIRVVPPIDPHPFVDKCPYDGYCLNGGTCMMFKIVGELVCQCVEGFKGQRCTEKEVYPTFNGNCHGPMKNNGHSQGRRCPRNQPAALWELLQQTLARRHKVSPWTKTQLLSWSPSHTGSAALWPHHPHHPHSTTPYPILPDSLSTLNPRLIEYLFPDHDFSEVTRRKGPLLSPWPTSPSDPLESQSSLVPHHLPYPPQPSPHHSLTQQAQEEGSSNSDDSSAFNTSLHLPRPPPGQSHSSNPAAPRHYATTTTTTHRHRHRHHLRAPVSLNATSDGVLSATQSPGQSQSRWRSEVSPTNLSPPPHYDPPHLQ